MPALVQEGASLIVAPASEHEALVKRGYVRVGDYQGDGREKSHEKRAYYQSSVAGRGAFRQGVAQTVHETWQGVDARTGRTIPGKTAGLITGSKATSIARKVNGSVPGSLDGKTPGEYLLPIFDDKGEVAGYERAMDPKKLARLPQYSHLGKAWTVQTPVWT